MEILYPNPFGDTRRSVAWYKIWASYVSNQTSVSVENTEVLLSEVKWNSDDGGSKKWGTKEFAGEAVYLLGEIKRTKEFTAILVKKNDDGTYLMLDGHHRIAVWPELSDSPKIPAVVVTVSPLSTQYGKALAARKR